MELLSNTSSPSITINSTRSSDSLYQLPMEPNNLTQQAAMAAAAAVDVSGGDSTSSGMLAAAAGVEGAVVEQQPADQEYSSILPPLELKLPILYSSSSDSESEDTAANPTAGTSADAEGERVASPPPNCAICLGRCKNKCFTDSCMHQFCFKCLCEWSKVKPECPLCKQTFKSIIHNVKSIDQFEEYHVQPPIVQIAHSQFDFPQMRMIVHQDVIRNDPWNDRIRHPRFLFTTNNSMGSMAISGGVNSRGGIRNLNDFSGDFLDLYRQEHPGNITNSDTLSQLWRRYVYDRKLYALPVCDINGRFRESSAQFYRDNPAQVHRLAPWINRDVICLLRRSQVDVTAVVESIQSALSIMNILSPAFRRRLTPYLGNKTAHFIHELNNFARSPHDMFGYDGVVEYSPQSNEEVIIEFTSSDDSTDNEINVADDSAVAMPAASTNAINLTIHNRLASNSGRSGDVGTVGGSSRRLSDDDVSLVIDLRGESEEQPAAASANDTASTEVARPPVPTVAENIELTSGSSDECEFVLERKPPHLRTPEMVSLDSASDSDVVFVDESKPLNKATFSTSEGEQGDADIPARSQRPTTRSKITALVEAKKRNQQSANAVKNENQNSSEVFNVGASTSAALRLSIQRRGDESRTRRNAYCLRNNRLESGQSQSSRRRGKRLGSESSQSSTSWDSTPATSSFGLSSTSDEEFVASMGQKQNASPRKRRRMRQSKKGKCISTSKRSSTKRKEPNDDESSWDDDDNGHVGKNYALVMAIGERLKRQQAKLRKYRPAGASDDEEDSEGENSWRMEAVHEPLRKQQQENAKATLKNAERKRKVRKTTQKTNVKQDCTAGDLSGKNATGAGDGEQTTYNNWETSSDESESDNLKLIELKSKLNTKTSDDKLEEPSISNRFQEETRKNSADSQSQNASATCTNSNPYVQTPPAIDTQFLKMEQEDMQNSTDNEEREDVGMEEEHFNDEPNEAADEEENHPESVNNNGEQSNEYQDEVENDYNHNENEYSNETTNLHEDDDEDQTVQQDDEESETPLNIPTPLNLSHESNVFDGASMSTTTTDTILNDAAEQISSAAVNFYNPQPTFNTADFADENTSNSSSSDSSVSTTTTTSSSNSSSSNTNGFVNFNLS